MRGSLGFMLTADGSWKVALDDREWGSPIIAYIDPSADYEVTFLEAGNVMSLQRLSLLMTGIHMIKNGSQVAAFWLNPDV